MDSARWDRIQALFHDAADLPKPEQRLFLEAACGDDARLLTDVLAMLEEDAQGGSLLDQDMARVASQVLGEALPPSLANQEFGPYRIKKVLGEGGMGVVYLAERADLGSRVAIKILRDAALSPARRERFASEQRTLAQLTHPYIARLYDADTLEDGTPWFAMEYVEGVPLTGYCRARASTVAQWLPLFRAICEAVDYAHRHAIIHRDLKPSNILVKADGTVRLLDFGIAKQLDPDGASRDHTLTGLRLMTPAYAAPEQIRGERASIQTDVYALGVILYELLTGRVPFDPAGRSSGELERMILEREPGKPSAAAAPGLVLSRAAWADLDVLCLTAMHKEAARRYRSVEALIRDVDHYLKAEPLEARPDTLGYRAGKFIRRNRRAVFAAAAVSITGVALVIFFTVRLAVARNAALAESARSDRIQRFMLNLFHGGDKEAGPAENLRVVDLLDRGVQEARSLDREPVAQADLYQTLGGIYQKLGKFDQADTLLRAALDQRKSLAGADSVGVAESQVELGLLRSDQAKLAEAERLVRDGLEMAKHLSPPNDAAVAKAMLALGRVLNARGGYAEAIAILEQAVKLESAAGRPTPELATTLSELATGHVQTGHNEQARALYERALTMHRELFGGRHPTVAGDLLNLANLQQDLGFYEDAERFARQALDITRPYYGNDHPQTAVNLTVLGRALHFQKRYDEAVDVLQQALVIRERVYGKTHPSVADTVNELGNVAYMRDQFDEAEAQFQRMIDIYRAVYHGRHFLIAIAESNLAAVYMDRKQYPRAEKLFREALRLFSETQSPDHVNTGIAHVKLGRTLLREGRYAEAEEQTLAGYRILIQQSNPADSYVRAARKDLRAVYEALHQPEKAIAFQEPIVAKAAPSAVP